MFIVKIVELLNQNVNASEIYLFKFFIRFFFCFGFFFWFTLVEIWKQDIGDQFQIEPSTQGVQDVNLKCGSNSMFVNLKTEADFTGVIYTKGNFYDQSEPCFMKPKRNRGTRNLSMRFNFDQCNTKHEGDLFTNVIVVQNDPELVTPGDAAFALSCDFRKPRSLSVSANYDADSR